LTYEIAKLKFDVDYIDLEFNENRMT